MNEAETRAEHIAPALAMAGWGIVEGSGIRREYQITLDHIDGHGKRGKPRLIVVRKFDMPCRSQCAGK